MNTITIRKIYLYLFALIGLVISTVGAIQLVNLGLKSFIFQDADMQYTYPIEKRIVTGEASSTVQAPTQEEMDAYNEKQRRSQRQRESANALAMLIVGLPLYTYHWKVIKREKDSA